LESFPEAKGSGQEFKSGSLIQRCPTARFMRAYLHGLLSSRKRLINGVKALFFKINKNWQKKYLKLLLVQRNDIDGVVIVRKKNMWRKRVCHLYCKRERQFYRVTMKK
jgi:hypothetical protein